MTSRRVSGKVNAIEWAARRRAKMTGQRTPPGRDGAGSHGARLRPAATGGLPRSGPAAGPVGGVSRARGGPAGCGVGVNYRVIYTYVNESRLSGTTTDDAHAALAVFARRIG